MITRLEDQTAHSLIKLTLGVVSMLLGFTVLGGRAVADLTTSEAAVSFPVGVTYTPVGAGMQTRGYTFTLDSARKLTHLGIYNHNGSGVTDTDRPIGVWDDAGNLVAAVTILSGPGTSELDPDGKFLYVALDSPVVLDADEVYTVGAHYVDNSPGLGFGFSEITAIEGFHYGVTAETGGAGGAFEKPTVIRDDRLNGYFGPNLRFGPDLIVPRWVAFNDCVDTDPATTPANATSFGLGRSYAGDGGSGNLIDFESGDDTGATVTFTENTSAGNTINWATDQAEFTPGTDADLIFGGKLNLSGNMSYNDSPGWSLDLTITNLDPGAAYTFAATVNRNGGDGYRSRITNWTIIGADAVTYDCSEGAHKMSDESVEFSTGNNPEGFVARWTDIRPGADGSFTIRTSHGVGEALGGLPGADPYRGYAGGLFMLMEQASLPKSFAITSIDYDAEAGSATITWPARSGRSYAVDFSGDLVGWTELDDGISADGDTASYTEEGLPASVARRFYRVRRLQ